MNNPHGTWRIFDGRPMYITIGALPSGEVRRVGVPWVITADVARLVRCLRPRDDR